MRLYLRRGISSRPEISLNYTPGSRGNNSASFFSRLCTRAFDADANVCRRDVQLSSVRTVNNVHQARSFALTRELHSNRLIDIVNLDRHRRSGVVYPADNVFTVFIILAPHRRRHVYLGRVTIHIERHEERQMRANWIARARARKGERIYARRFNELSTPRCASLLHEDRSHPRELRTDRRIALISRLRVIDEKRTRVQCQPERRLKVPIARIAPPLPFVTIFIARCGRYRGSIKISPGNLFRGLRCRVTRDAIKSTAGSMRDRNNVSPLIRRADVRPAVTAVNVVPATRQKHP